MLKKILVVLIALVVFEACSDGAKKAPAAGAENTETGIMNADSTATDVHDLYKEVKFDSNKDLICGMPISAGVSDTAHYKEKVYGFCSKECKDEFVKNPAAYIAAK
ncbi:MAG TPA: YHS domain-containing protein [Sediminibacterium sp.]|nr:YHS domain-containing protein [Sediminibacterium sp.]